MFRRVPTGELDAAVIGLIQGWIERRLEGESFPAFARRSSDAELGELARLEPARQRGASEETE